MKRRQLPSRQVAGKNVATADPQDRADRAKDQQDHDGRQHGPGANPAHGRRERGLDPPAEQGPVHGLVHERLDRAYVAQAFLDIGADIGDAVLAGAAEAAHLPPIDQDWHDYDRHDEGDEPGEFRAGHRKHDRSTEEQQDVAQRHRHRRADHGLQQRRVGGEPRQDLADPRHFEKRGAETQYMVIDGPADVRDDPLADPGNEIEPAEGRQCQDADDDEQRQQRLIEQSGVAAGEALVDEPAEALAEHQDGRRGRRQRDDGAGDRQLVGSKKTAKAAQLAQLAAVLFHRCRHCSSHHRPPTVLQSRPRLAVPMAANKGRHHRAAPERVLARASRVSYNAASSREQTP